MTNTKLQDELDTAIKERDAAIRERDVTRAAIHTLERTIARIEKAREEDRAVFDAALNSPDSRHQKARVALDASKHCEFLDEAAARVVRERDEARAALNSRDAILCAALETVTKERDEARAALNDARRDSYSRLSDARKALGTKDYENVDEAAARVVRERDEARASLDGVRGQCHEFAKQRDMARELEARANGRALGYLAQANRLAREVDQLKSEKADRTEASADTKPAARSRVSFQLGPIKVGDCVVNVADGEIRASVIGFFDAIDGVRFAAVSDAWDRPYFWRLDLCRPAPVST